MARPLGRHRVQRLSALLRHLNASVLHQRRPLSLNGSALHIRGPNKQAQLAALHLQAQAKPKKERAKAAKALAKEYNVGPQYPRQVAKKVIAKK